MPIRPDTKNWTWVLERPCADCGFDPGGFGFRDVPRLTRANVGAWRQVLAGDRLAVRPDDATWSPLEYAAHTRDVFRIMHARLNLMLVLHAPEFVDWNQDDTAAERDYRNQDPTTVWTELAAAGAAIAAAFEQVPDGDLDRRGLRGDGSAFTVESLAVYFVHDPVHHLWDVTGARFAG